MTCIVSKLFNQNYIMQEDRKKLLEEYQGDKPRHLVHPWLDYDRYRYSNKIITTLKEKGEDFSKLVVVDYGSGVGDYGFDFGRNGAEVYFYDNDTYCNFVKFRYEKEEKKFTCHVVYINSGNFFKDMVLGDPKRITVAIFGEVLEHLENPLEVLQQFVDNKTKYIFTSSYPFRNDDPNDDYWKHPGHVHDLPRQQQPACRELLFKHYNRIQYNGEASLWVLK